MEGTPSDSSAQPPSCLLGRAITERPGGEAYPEYSLGLLHLTAFPRQIAIRIIQWPRTQPRPPCIPFSRPLPFLPQALTARHPYPALYPLPFDAAFDMLVLFAIVVNCIFMALNPPFEWLERESDLVFISIFSVEMTLKIVRDSLREGGELHFSPPC